MIGTVLLGRHLSILVGKRSVLDLKGSHSYEQCKSYLDIPIYRETSNQLECTIVI